MKILDELKYDSNGLIPAVVQEADTGRVLMMAWMNKESLRRTLEIGETVFWSRSRKEFWHKGATSGHTQKVVDVAFDCDKDCLLIQVRQTGAACHEGFKSCFYRSIRNGEVVVTEPRLVDPETVYGKK
ncbi:MAG: phosphoribosyl-AMP cyclohydrolase [Verrucomicrobiae bacterium]|nr:phosphoribosyl-AMP cyclohydrolase [Verrucomicrobiae bacterium]